MATKNWHTSTMFTLAYNCSAMESRHPMSRLRTSSEIATITVVYTRIAYCLNHMRVVSVWNYTPNPQMGHGVVYFFMKGYLLRRTSQDHRRPLEWRRKKYTCVYDPIYAAYILFSFTFTSCPVMTRGWDGLDAASWQCSSNELISISLIFIGLYVFDNVQLTCLLMKPWNVHCKSESLAFINHHLSFTQTGNCSNHVLFHVYSLLPVNVSTVEFIMFVINQNLKSHWNTMSQFIV